MPDWGAAAGAVSDLLGAKGTRTQGSLKAAGIKIGAQGLRIKAQGDLAEASNYDLASGLARKNEDFTRMSTEVKQFQLSREINKTIGGQAADVAAAGFGASGSALDLLRESASQGALSQAVLGYQGLITEAGYEEQAKSYDTMAASSRMASAGEMDMANKEDVIAIKTEQAAKEAAKVQQITGVMKGVSFIASLFPGLGGGGGGSGGGASGGGAAAEMDATDLGPEAIAAA